MKKITFSLFLFSAAIANAQLPVSQALLKKNALIEEFTGIHCGFCPDGHKISDQITAANAGKAFSVNIHPISNYSTPGAGELDFRNTDGNAIGAMPEMGGGYPKGDVNRSPCTQPMVAGGLAMGRGSWSAAVNAILAQNSYVNIAGNATLNTTTRVLTVDIEAYYTGNGPASNKLTIMLLQDNIMGTQSSGSTYPAMWNGSQYRHMHALRDVITAGSTGQPMGATIATTLYTTTVSYTVPTAYLNIPVVFTNLTLLAFVSDANGKNTNNVCKIPITSTATSVNELANSVNNVYVFPNPAVSNTTVTFNTSEAANVSVSLSNVVGQTVLTENLGQLNAGNHNYSLDAANLQNGLYLVSITAGGSTMTKTLSIDK